MNKIIDRSVTALLFLLCLVILFVFNHTQVNGDSMRNTYQTYDRLLLNLVDRNFKRGDIVTVFADNQGAGFIPNSINTIYQVFYKGRIVLVKRVIAIAGDEIQMIDKRIILYNSANPQGVIIEEPYAKNDWICQNSSPNPDFSFKKTTIPEGHVFVMGDNRGCSQDSRYYGPFKKESILGKVINKFNWIW